MSAQATTAGSVSLGQVVSAELLKIRTTRMWWGLLALGVALTLLVAVLTAATAGASFGGQPSATPGPDDATVLRSIYGSGFTTGYIMPLVLGIIGVSGEYRHKTITPSLLAVPRRLRLVMGKLLAYALAGVGYGVALTAAAVLGGGITVALRGYPIGLGASGVLRTLALAVLGCAVWAVFGLGLGTLIRNQVAAIIVGIATQTFLEPLLALLLNVWDWGGRVAQFLPSQASAALVSGPTGGFDIQILPWWGGATVLVLYGLGFAALGGALTLRRDIT